MSSVDRRLPPGFLAEALRADARAGLASDPKSLPPKWFYDAQGSALFEKITELREYYPTRAEREILRARAASVAALTRARTLVELGSGSSEKTRLLLDALRAEGTLRCYAPVDVSEAALIAAADALTAEYPGLDVRAVVSDFEEHLGFPDEGDAPSPRLVAFLGSTIGNLLPDQRAAFLGRVRAAMRPGDFFLLGTDLVKDPATLIAAYDDDSGLTAEFNKNVLAVLNAELGADFDPDEFEHVAVWDAAAEWIEMRLRSLADQAVHLPAIGLTVAFAGRRGNAHRGIGQVPPGGGGSRAGRGRPGHAVMVDGLRGPVRPVAVGARLNGPAPRPGRHARAARPALRAGPLRRSSRQTVTESPACLPMARRMSARTGSLWVPSPKAMNELRNGWPSMVPRTLTRPRVPKNSADCGHIR